MFFHSPLKVLLLSLPGIEDFYTQCCNYAEDGKLQGDTVHPTALFKVPANPPQSPTLFTYSIYLYWYVLAFVPQFESQDECKFLQKAACKCI